MECQFQNLLLARADDQDKTRLRQLIADGQLGCQLLERPMDCQLAPACRWLDERALNDPARVQAALSDAVELLERTRHAFRSRELGELRRRLTRLLDELSQDSRLG